MPVLVGLFCSLIGLFRLYFRSLLTMVSGLRRELSTLLLLPWLRRCVCVCVCACVCVCVEDVVTSALGAAQVCV